MGYCDQTDIEKYLDDQALLDLADDDGDGTPDTGVIEEAIESAGAEIDAYLSTQYSTPLLTVPAIVRRLAAKLAAHFLFMRRTEVEVSGKWENEIKETRRMLEKLSRGEMQLGTGAPQQSGDLSEAARSEDEATFSRERMSGY